MSDSTKMAFVILLVLGFLIWGMAVNISLAWDTKKLIESRDEKILDNRTELKDLKARISCLEMEKAEMENRLQAVQELTVNNSIALYGKKGIRPDELEMMNRKIEPLKNNYIPEVRE
jgi:hypothetical protein